jgi:MarR family transcriptional regulator, lower aerobic nicotinate degradation pathway regulator
VGANDDMAGSLPSNPNSGLSQEGRFRIGLALRRIHQKNQSIWQDRCPDSALTSVQASALSVLHYQGPLSLSELGAAAAIDLSTVRGVVDRLVKRNLMVLLPDQKDGRKVIVKLTPNGEKLITKMFPVMRGIADATMEPLNPAERVALEFLIRKLLGEPT